MDYHITEPAWARIYTFLRATQAIRAGTEVKLRRFIEAIYFIARSGCQWRLLPNTYGHWRAIHRRYFRWAQLNIWQQLMEYMADPDLQEVMMDGTIVRANACAAGYKKGQDEAEGLGRSVGGFSCKIHALVDALGLPIKFIFTAGQQHDSVQAAKLIEDLPPTNILADKAYDSQTFVDEAKNKQHEVTIPSRSNSKNPREYDNHIYKERCLVECFFSKIKYFRRVFSRFDKSMIGFAGFVYFVGTLIWLR